MSEIVYNSLQLREVFHLEFLRWLGRKIKAKHYAVKGGVNLRFFFNSFRYSEDMDLDVEGVEIDALKGAVMRILEAPSFQDIFKPFGVERIIPSDITRAKQTSTTQRFRVHLITLAGEDLFTKIEFSRHGFKGKICVQLVSDIVLRLYKLPPLPVPHYDIQSAIGQKIGALCSRAVTQPRDIFDLYVLSPQYEFSDSEYIKMSRTKLEKAHENIFEVSFEQFRDSVISYLSPEDRQLYGLPSLWDEIKLKVAGIIEEIKKKNG